ncbi:hypothetical protein, partial [Parabacteroides distasonis]|uniref:hypothetical protein n=1 Tax=Parabacteroides distasonis TaxID=823 RepID=UPI00232E8B78
EEVPQPTIPPVNKNIPAAIKLCLIIVFSFSLNLRIKANNIHLAQYREFLMATQRFVRKTRKYLII